MSHSLLLYQRFTTFLHFISIILTIVICTQPLFAYYITSSTNFVPWRFALTPFGWQPDHKQDVKLISMDCNLNTGARDRPWYFSDSNCHLYNGIRATLLMGFFAGIIAFIFLLLILYQKYTTSITPRWVYTWNIFVFCNQLIMLILICVFIQKNDLEYNFASGFILLIIVLLIQITIIILTQVIFYTNHESIREISPEISYPECTWVHIRSHPWACITWIVIMITCIMEMILFFQPILKYWYQHTWGRNIRTDLIAITPFGMYDPIGIGHAFYAITPDCVLRGNINPDTLLLTFNDCQFYNSLRATLMIAFLCGFIELFLLTLLFIPRYSHRISHTFIYLIHGFICINLCISFIITCSWIRKSDHITYSSESGIILYIILIIIQFLLLPCLYKTLHSFSYDDETKSLHVQVRDSEQYGTLEDQHGDEKTRSSSSGAIEFSRTL